jgi:hypothetical protein
LLHESSALRFASGGYPPFTAEGKEIPATKIPTVEQLAEETGNKYFDWMAPFFQAVRDKTMTNVTEDSVVVYCKLFGLPHRQKLMNQFLGGAYGDRSALG